MTDTQKLLAEYVDNGSETAFRELVSRHIDFVYATALRLADGNSQLAEDIAQTVFVDLARLAGTLSRNAMLGGWLHRHTCFVASTALRSERRRQIRERQAAEMNSSPDHSEDNLARIAPILDEAINQLGAEDRAAILLRFFEQRDLRSVGEALAIGENAARMRVNRALEKLHLILKRRGVAFSSAALGAALATQPAAAAPAGLAAVISTAALANAAGGTVTTATLFKIMTITKLKFGIIATIVAAGVVVPMALQHQARVNLREENQSLRQQVDQLSNQVAQMKISQQLSSRRASAPRLPAPQITAPATVAPPSEDLPTTNVISRLLRGDTAPKLTAAQVEPYLKENQRNAASLLAAFRTTGDPALLQEAMQKYPNDPQVAFEAVFRKDVSPDERRQWLEVFKQSAPDNALANYISALDHFKSGQADQAVQELTAAAGKSQFRDFTLERIQDDEEAYRAAGYSVSEAKAVSACDLMLPQLGELKQLGLSMVDLAKSYRQAGDEASAQAALQMAVGMGQHFDGMSGSAGMPLVTQLVGIAIERIALGAMDPASPYGTGGQTVKDRLEQLSNQRTALGDVAKQTTDLLPRMSDHDWISYKDRERAFGEEAAARWLVNKYGQK